MGRLREGLSILLDEERPIAPRFTRALDRVPGLGPAIATAVLQVAYPDRYGVWNGKSEDGLRSLGIWPETESGVSKGEVYAEVNEVLNHLSDQLEVDLWTLDVLWEDLSRSPEEEERNIWLIAPGEGAKLWDDCVENRYIAIGWDKLGNLLEYESQDEIKAKMEELYGWDNPKNSSLACWEFGHEIEVGDLVFAKEGQTQLLGVGVVRSGYRFGADGQGSYPHRHDVNWIRVGEWEVSPRTRPQSEWSREKKESDVWRKEPRQLPQKTLTSLTDYTSMVAELSIRVGIDEHAALGEREPLPVDKRRLETAVEGLLRPEIESGAFEAEDREAYLHQSVLPAAQRSLIPEAIEENPREAVKQALQAHGNLLHSTEIVKASDFMEEAGEDELQRRIEDLLHSDDSIEDRAARFLEWGGRHEGPEGETIGFNGTAVSYLLAMDSPATQAFCKPTVYEAAVQALVGEEHIVGASDEANRIAHASRLYAELARRMRRDYDLPIRDLLHVHSLLYLLSERSSLKKDWESLFPTKPNPNAYWLNCNPDRWDPRDWRIGQRQIYTARTSEGNKRRIYDNFLRVEPGDVLVGYLTTPEKRVAAEFRITKALHQDEEGTECIEFVKVKDYDEGPTYSQLQEHSEFSESTIGLQGSLFELTPTQFETLRDLAGGQSYPEYEVSDATENLFYDRADVEKWLSALQSKKNIILQGPPGVGKTFVARRLAYALIGRKDPTRVQMVQFHQSYSYEDFIRGYRPKEEKGGFSLENGVFYNFCRRAKESSDPYVFIIDEINRGNLSKIFGELMMLIERDKRGPDFRMPLTYQRDGESDFFVPENVYLIGMMNTADRSLAMVDYALRRRFRFINMEPRFHSAAFARFLGRMGASSDLIKQIRRRLTDLNETIAKDETNLGPGFCIGHSYFCPRDGEVPDQDWYEETIEQEIAPLLREYWFDDTEKADSEIDRLFGPDS